MRTESAGPLSRFIALCLSQRPLVFVAALLLAVWGWQVAPVGGDGLLPRDPVAVDAIPNLADNQQIVFAEWPGRSPQDVEDQITYPLSSALLGVAGVRDVRSLSMFGFSSVAVIFEEDVEFYWSRSRLLEKLASLPAGTLPPDVQPALGPDATAMGQVLWYTLEGRDPDGEPAPGWDLHELRSLQDWTVKPALLAAQGISEVASVGGYVQEYLVEADPEALRQHGVSLTQLAGAVADSNLDVGAGVTEINRVEYTLRGVGKIQQPADIEQAVVMTREGQVPLRVSDLARVSLAAAPRRGLLDVAGAEATGGVVAVREGYNPRAAIANVREQMKELAMALPARAVINWQNVDRATVEHFAHQQQLPTLSDDTQPQWQAWLREHWQDRPQWLTLSQVTLVPFYDRAELIDETVTTLTDALTQQLLITLVVVLVLLGSLRSVLAVATTLPMAVLMSFIGMKLLGVEANIVALAGIAIAIGTIVDMAIIVTETIHSRRSLHPQEPLHEGVYRAVNEVGGAVLTAIATTVISFLPVFVMTGAEGKLFTPLAYTKTLVLLASVVLALTLVPALLMWLLRPRHWRLPSVPLLLAVGVVLLGVINVWLLLLALPAALLIWIGRARLVAFWQRRPHLPHRLRHLPLKKLLRYTITLAAGLWLALVWEPMGPERAVANSLFVLLLFALVLGGVALLLRSYDALLEWMLEHKGWFLTLPALLVLLGLGVWLGADRLLQPVAYLAESAGGSAASLRDSRPWRAADRWLPGLGREFMPALDEGVFLWMPSTMPHASTTEVQAVMSQQNRAIAAIPEVESVVGKAGRAETPLDPAPLSMIETIIQYQSEYTIDADGKSRRQWRDHIHSPEDIWQEIVAAARLPGSTSAPKLQPIETRLVMLQTGMRAAVGIKVTAPDLAALEEALLTLEAAVREEPSVASGSVNAERPVGKPWLEIRLDRERIARHGLSVAEVQRHISLALGGEVVTRTLEGRERYSVRVRYPREQRHTPEQIAAVSVATATGAQVPLSQLASIDYVRGPQMIRTENTFLTGYLTFGGAGELAEVELVEAVSEHLQQRQLSLPAGVSYSFAGTWEQQQRAAATLMWVVPLALVLILMLLYLQFRALSTALMVFSAVAVAWAGGFIMLHLYAQEWFLNVALFGVNLRELFAIQPVNLSIAVWVGFLALFGIAVDDGVVMGTYLGQRFADDQPRSREQIRQWTLEAARRRVRPCLMTSATTLLALLPVLSASGRGADLMIPMAIPTFGGMLFVTLSMFMVPVLYCWQQERAWQRLTSDV